MQGLSFRRLKWRQRHDCTVSGSSIQDEEIEYSFQIIVHSRHELWVSQRFMLHARLNLAIGFLQCTLSEASDVRDGVRAVKSRAVDSSAEVSSHRLINLNIPIQKSRFVASKKWQRIST